MKKLLLMAMLALSAAVASADGLTINAARDAGFEKLTESQKAEVLSYIAKSKTAAEAAEKKAESTPAAAAAVANSTPQKVNEWLDVGTKIGQMFGGAAKELGVAVNDFVKTPVGQWTMAIVVWKYMGGVIVHVFGGALVLFIGIGMLLFVMRRQGGVEIEYDTERKSWRGEPLIKSMTRKPIDGDAAAGYLIGTAVTIMVALVCIFSY